MDAWALLIQPPKKVHLVIRSKRHGCMAPAHTTTKKVPLVIGSNTDNRFAPAHADRCQKFTGQY